MQDVLSPQAACVAESQEESPAVKPTIKQALARKRVEKTLALLKSVRCDNFVVIGKATWQASEAIQSLFRAEGGLGGEEQA
jgi:hypothetical protein